MRLRKNADVFIVDYAQAARLNPIICRAFAQHLDDEETRRSHYFGGRFENIYMDREKIPEVGELLGFAEASAREALRLEDTALRARAGITFWSWASRRPAGKARGGRIVDYLTDEQRSQTGWIGVQDREVISKRALTSGFWFNEMKPGQRTLPHTHDDGDELLSGVYYLRVPEGSGNLVILDGPMKTIVEPQEGMFVFFGPHVLHEVTANLSGEARLSLALNIGPAS